MGEERERQELSDKEIVERLKTILKCIESNDLDVRARNTQQIEDGRELFKIRKELLRVPDDMKKEELKILLAEKKNEEKEVKAEKKDPETVMKTIYPEKNEEAEPVKTKECGKTPETLNNGGSSLLQPSQVDLENMKEGLLQGPYMNAFVTEMRMGNVIVGCQCTKRNGLQADCKRKMCGGKKSCLLLPLPNCVPSGFGRIKPKQPKVFIGEVSSCPKEEIVPQEKTVQAQVKQMPLRKDYIDNPLKTSYVCNIHAKGRYYLRPLQRNSKTQTEQIETIEEDSQKQLITCPQITEIT